MFKHYFFALIKANLLVFLIFGLLYLLGLWGIYSEYYVWIFIVLNVYFQLTKMGYKEAEDEDENWDWIRLTEGKKWYHRYLDYKIRERLKGRRIKL